MEMKRIKITVVTFLMVIVLLGVYIWNKNFEVDGVRRVRNYPESIVNKVQPGDFLQEIDRIINIKIERE